jgi:hypothetical protein
MRDLGTLQGDSNFRTYPAKTHGANINWQSRIVKSKQPHARTSCQNPPLQVSAGLPPSILMSKKSLPVLFLSLLLAGCATQLTNLTPQQQVRNANNLYPVEVSFDTRQQTVRWNSIQPKIVVGAELYEMRPTPLMTNRWEGLIPVPPGTSLIHYRYKLDFQYNKMGKPGADTALSHEYSLRILNQ